MTTAASISNAASASQFPNVLGGNGLVSPPPMPPFGLIENNINTKLSSIQVRDRINDKIICSTDQQLGPHHSELLASNVHPHEPLVMSQVLQEQFFFQKFWK